MINNQLGFEFDDVRLTMILTITCLVAACGLRACAIIGGNWVPSLSQCCSELLRQVELLSNHAIAPLLSSVVPHDLGCQWLDAYRDK